MSQEKEKRTIIRVKHNRDNPYVMINKKFLEDQNLSWKAKGLLAYLLSRPDDWVIMIGDLIDRSKDGRDAVYAGLRELERQGYIVRRPIRNEKGVIRFWEKIVYECPLTETPEVDKRFPDFPDTGFPDTGFPDTDNPTLLNNDPITNKRYELSNDRTIIREASGKKETSANAMLSEHVDDDVIQMELNKRGIKAARSTVKKWLRMSDMPTVRAAIEEAAKRTEVKNPIGYVTTLLRNGYTAPSSATQTVIASTRNRDPKYAAFYALIEQSERRGGLLE